MPVETMDIKALVLDPANARKHDQKNLEAIKGSLARFGQQKPIVIDKNNVVRAGNGTLQAARELGWAQVWVHRSDLTGSEMTAYALADNRTAELAEWDTDVLRETLLALGEEDFPLVDIGFEIPDAAPADIDDIDDTLTHKGKMDPGEKLKKYLESNVRTLQLAYEENEFEDLVEILNRIVADNDLASHSAGIKWLLENYADTQLNQTED